MKPTTLFSTAAMALLLLGAGCGSSAPSDSSNTNVRDQDVTTGGQSVTQIQNTLGFSVPDDSEAVTVVDNPQQYMATIATGLTFDEAEGFFDYEIESAGFDLKRNWSENTNPYQGTVRSATFMKGGKSLGIFLREKNGETQVEFNLEQ